MITIVVCCYYMNPLCCVFYTFRCKPLSSTNFTLDCNARKGNSSFAVIRPRKFSNQQPYLLLHVQTLNLQFASVPLHSTNCNNATYIKLKPVAKCITYFLLRSRWSRPISIAATVHDLPSDNLWLSGACWHAMFSPKVGLYFICARRKVEISWEIAAYC